MSDSPAERLATYLMSHVVYAQDKEEYLRIANEVIDKFHDGEYDTKMEYVSEFEDNLAIKGPKEVLEEIRALSSDEILNYTPRASMLINRWMDLIKDAPDNGQSYVKELVNGSAK